MPTGDAQERLERLSGLLDETFTMLNQHGESQPPGCLALAPRVKSPRGMACISGGARDYDFACLMT